MLRPFLSLVVAGAATAVGAWLTLGAAVRHSRGVATLRPDTAGDAMLVVGSAVLGLAAASLLIHWLGVFVVGAIHLLLGGLAVLVPTGGLLSGAYSPIFEVASMLRGLDRDLGDGALMFSFSGVEFALGAFLVAAALGVRTRQDREPAPRAVATGASLIGAVVLAGAVALLATVGGDFSAQLFRMLQYDTLLAFGVALAAVLAGIAGLTLRWASSGVLFIGGVTLVAGLIAVFGASQVGGIPVWLLLTPLVSYGFAIVLGTGLVITAVVAAIPVQHAVPVDDDAL